MRFRAPPSATRKGVASAGLDACRILRPRSEVARAHAEHNAHVQFRPFGEWMAEARPEHRWDYRHFREMQRVLDDVSREKSRRVMFNVPIRHGKTEHNTIGYAAYRLEQRPSTKILVGSYNQKQANKLSREIKRLAIKRGVKISREVNSAGEWETEEGGGVRAVGAGTGVASVNADLVIIDDPIGKRADAESPAHRNLIWDWFTNDILARTEPHTAVLFTMSRWHMDDPAGRILQRMDSAKWVVIDLPGEAEPKKFNKDTGTLEYEDPLGRESGEPLWPELRGRAWLAEKLEELLSYGFASLVQGRPRPREGGMFKWEWWGDPIKTVPAIGYMVRYWDLAGTKKREEKKSHDPDWTAGALICAMIDKRRAICDIRRFRKAVHERDAEIEAIAREDIRLYSGRVRWWIETEAGIAGEERTQALVRRLQAIGMPVYTEHPTGNKVLRAEPLASKAGARNVVLVEGDWNEPFMLEAADFPNGNHDDQVDAAAGADAKLDAMPPWQPVQVAF